MARRVLAAALLAGAGAFTGFLLYFLSSLAAALVLWPSPETTKAAMAAPVQVQDVSTADPDRSVMVYSNPDDDVTVIWVFNPSEQDEQS